MLQRNYSTEQCVSTLVKIGTYSHLFAKTVFFGGTNTRPNGTRTLAQTGHISGRFAKRRTPRRGSPDVLRRAIVCTCCAEKVKNHSLPLFEIRRTTAIGVARPKLTGALKSQTEVFRLPDRDYSRPRLLSNAFIPIEGFDDLYGFLHEYLHI